MRAVVIVGAVRTGVENKGLKDVPSGTYNTAINKLSFSFEISPSRLIVLKQTYLFKFRCTI